MKKLMLAVSLTIVFCAALPGCASSSGESINLENTVSVNPDGKTEGTVINIQEHSVSDKVVETETMILQEDSCETGTSYLADVKFNIETYTEENVEVQYIQVADLYDIVQEKLNQNIQDFYLWQWMYGTDENAGSAQYQGTADYAFVGKRLLSVRRYMSVSDGGAYPENEISAQTFDVTTGEPVGALNAKPFTEEIMQEFHLTYPEGEVSAELTDKAEQALRNFVYETDDIYNYFLLDTSIAIFVGNDIHGESDYFIFEAESARIADVLSDSVRSAFGL